jgi:hypothetical protein
VTDRASSVQGFGVLSYLSVHVHEFVLIACPVAFETCVTMIKSRQALCLQALFLGAIA